MQKTEVDFFCSATGGVRSCDLSTGLKIAFCCLTVFEYHSTPWAGRWKSGGSVFFSSWPGGARELGLGIQLSSQVFSSTGSQFLWCQWLFFANWKLLVSWKIGSLCRFLIDSRGYCGAHINLCFPFCTFWSARSDSARVYGTAFVHSPCVVVSDCLPARIGHSHAKASPLSRKKQILA